MYLMPGAGSSTRAASSALSTSGSSEIPGDHQRKTNPAER